MGRMSEPRSRAAELAAKQVETIVAAAEKAAAQTRRQAEKQARELLEEARRTGRRELEEARRKALELGQDAQKEAQATAAEARDAAEAGLAEAPSLAASLREAGERLGAEADRLVRDVQLTHRELLSELRLPGLAERRPEDPDETATEGRILGEPPRQRPAPSEVFDLPDWVAGDS